MEIKKITIIGNSVALRNRPHLGETSLNYGQILEKSINLNADNKIYVVENMAFGRALVDEIYEIQDQIINSFADLYILNIGVCDAATREMPLWIANILNKKKESKVKTLFKGLNIFFFKKFRRKLVLLRGKKTWTNKSKFKKTYSNLLAKIKANTSGKIICLSILPANKRIENLIPGSTISYKEYNKIIKDICLKNNGIYLDLKDLNTEKHYPDGTHFNEEGNKLVAKHLMQLIKAEKLL